MRNKTSAISSFVVCVAVVLFFITIGMIVQNGSSATIQNNKNLIYAEDEEFCNRFNQRKEYYENLQLECFLNEYTGRLERHVFSPEEELRPAKLYIYDYDWAEIEENIDKWNQKAKLYNGEKGEFDGEKLELIQIFW